MGKAKVALVIAASVLAAAGGALLVSEFIRNESIEKDPLTEAQEMISECYRKIDEIHNQIRSTDSAVNPE